MFRSIQDTAKQENQTEYSLTHIVFYSTSIISEHDGENVWIVLKNAYDFSKEMLLSFTSLA